MKVIRRKDIFRLHKTNSTDKFKSYLISAYLGSNKKSIRILCYKKTDAEAIEIFDKLISKYKASDDVKKFIESHVRKLTKHDNPNYIHTDDIVFRGTLGKKLEKFLETKNKEPISSAYKTTIKYIVGKINAKIVREESITKEIIDSIYTDITNESAHLSPETIKNYRNVLRQLCTFLEKDEKKLMKDFVIRSKSQLKKQKINFKDKNRTHFERSQIKLILNEIITCDDIKIRSNIFTMLWLGIRPGDLDHIKETKDRIIVKTNKTETICSFEKNRFFEVYRILTEIELNGLNQKHSSKYFLNLTERLFNKRYDQYCIRHTVISQRVLNNEVLKLVSQEAGHASLRMLDSNYANRIMSEGCDIGEEIIFKNVLQTNYRCWLIQELMLIRWPELKSRQPNDQLYKEVISLLKSDIQKVKYIDL